MKRKTNKKSPEKKPRAKTAKKPNQIRYCLEDGCKAPAVSKGYCRLHYLKNWQQIKTDEKERGERRLNAYVDRLSKKYPRNYLEKIREGLETEERFQQASETAGLVDDVDESENEFIEKLTRKIKIDE